jgi:hypothetical protein
VAIYAIHTNLDNVTNGVNFRIASLLGLQNVNILSPVTQKLQKLTFFTPTEQSQQVLEALYEVGAGKIGKYEHCSFSGEGIGSFKPTEQANPTIGTANQQEFVKETRAEIMYPSYLQGTIVSTLKKVHPYEEVAYYISDLKNVHQEIGAGTVGDLPYPMEPQEFLAFLKDKMNAPVIKYTPVSQLQIQKVAVCGGSGSFLLQRAKQVKADVFVTADFKYHEFFDAEKQIMICDIGHYESEVNTKQLLLEYISKKFSNFALCLSDTNTNPVHYFI